MSLIDPEEKLNQREIPDTGMTVHGGKTTRRKKNKFEKLSAIKKHRSKLCGTFFPPFCTGKDYGKVFS